MSRTILRPPPEHFKLIPKEDISKGTRLYYRFNPAAFDSCFYFSRNREFRFDDTAKNYGVFYAAEQPAGAFAETYGHDVTQQPAEMPLVLSEVELTQRKVFMVRIHKARLALLTGNGLPHLRLDGNIGTCPDYDIPQQWSQWIFQHPKRYDGILYASRHNGCPCVALFSRAKKKITSEKNLGSALDFRHPNTGETIFDIMQDQGWAIYP